ncbi:endonuclease/exonuclease/phosphatase family protein [Portibacter lacus]|uniref:Endonuclease/exonuclease/phosphatase family protein n=2 Tax=Portibacter lacus TaxID=1099794 RepID=A0AA37STA7_9BACT|nr:endonuclease/exonuclease/phosphatase family protein [Portibacter lacus]
MAFRKKWNAVVELNPDILVIQECEHESKYKLDQLIPDYNEFIWIGENLNKGIGIISFNNYHIDLLPNYSDDFKYIIPLEVTGVSTFNLFAIWAMPHKTKLKSYVGQIWNALNYYHSEINASSLLVGDWNSNAIWNHERKIGNHGQVVDFLEEFGIRSIYHELRKEEHGDELEPTLFLLKNKEKPYHMDYCFASKDKITEKTTVRVGKYEDWIHLSDHMPVIVDHLEN